MTTKRWVKAVATAVCVAVVLFIGYAWHIDGRGAATDDPQAVAPPDHLPPSTAEVRGQYLARAADCEGCHTAAGGKAYAGGRAFRFSFGTIYSTNITPDRDTGIGTWTDDEFLRAVRSGVGRGGRHLYPAFPYTAYAGMSRTDVLAITAYLMAGRARR